MRQIPSGPAAVDASIAKLRAGRMPRFVQVGVRVSRSYYDGPLGKREIIDRDPIFALEDDDGES